MVIKSNRKKTAVIFGIILCLTAMVFYVSLLVGKYPIAPKEVTGIFRGREMDEMAARVFFTLRFPRTIMAFLAGVWPALFIRISFTILWRPRILLEFPVEPTQGQLLLLYACMEEWLWLPAVRLPVGF